MDQNRSLDLNDIDDNQRYQGNNNLNIENLNNRPSRLSFTLDETKTETIKRDLLNVYEKAKIALFPMASKDSTLLQDWDFWGPLIFCLILGLVLSWQRNDNHSGIVFILIFVIVWFGGLIISLNSRFLGVGLSVFQCICILGYCMVAIVLASCANLILGFLPLIFQVCISLAGCLYSTYAATIFVSVYANQNKKILVIYPIGLFYLFLAWFTLAK